MAILNLRVTPKKARAPCQSTTVHTITLAPRFLFSTLSTLVIYNYGRAEDNYSRTILFSLMKETEKKSVFILEGSDEMGT